DAPSGWGRLPLPALQDPGAVEGSPQDTGQDAQRQARGRGDRGRDGRPGGHPAASGELGGLGVGSGEDGGEPAQVVEEADHAVDHHHQSQPPVTAVPGGGGGGQFAHEDRQGRGAHQPQQRHQHGQSQPWAGAGQPAVFGEPPVLGQGSGHGKGGDVGHGVGGQVEQQRGQGQV